MFDTPGCIGSAPVFQTKMRRKKGAKRVVVIGSELVFLVNAEHNRIIRAQVAQVSLRPL